MKTTKTYIFVKHNYFHKEMLRMTRERLRANYGATQGKLRHTWQLFNLDLMVSFIRNSAVQHASRVGGQRLKDVHQTVARCAKPSNTSFPWWIISFPLWILSNTLVIPWAF